MKYVPPKGVQAKPRDASFNPKPLAPMMMGGLKAVGRGIAGFMNDSNVVGQANSDKMAANLKHKKHKSKNWIKGAIKHPGALHTELGVPQGKKIPAKKLAVAAKKGGKEGKRARLAETLKKLKHKKNKKMKKASTMMKRMKKVPSKMNKKMCKKHKRMHCATC